MMEDFNKVTFFKYGVLDINIFVFNMTISKPKHEQSQCRTTYRIGGSRDFCTHVVLRVSWCCGQND